MLARVMPLEQLRREGRRGRRERERVESNRRHRFEGDRILVCTSDAIWKAKDMRRDPRVALSVTDMSNPYRMAAVQGRVVEIRSDEGCRYMDPISIKYTGAPFPSRGPDRVCFVIAVEKAAQRTLSFVHKPG